MSGGDGIVMVYGTLPTLKEIAGAVGDVLGVNDPEVRLGHVPNVCETVHPIHV